MCLLQDAALDLPGGVIHTVCHICTALPFYTPKMFNSKAYLGLWSCKQAFLSKSRNELVQLLEGFRLNLNNSLMARRVVKNGYFLPKDYIKLRDQNQYLTWNSNLNVNSGLTTGL